MTSPSWPALADAIIARRAPFALGHAELGRVTQVSESTTRKLQKAHAESHRPDVLARRCRALRWSLGSIDRVLRGENPATVYTPEERSATLEARLAALEATPAPQEFADRPTASIFDVHLAGLADNTQFDIIEQATPDQLAVAAGRDTRSQSARTSVGRRVNRPQPPIEDE